MFRMCGVTDHKGTKTKKQKMISILPLSCRWVSLTGPTIFCFFFLEKVDSLSTWESVDASRRTMAPACQHGLEQHATRMDDSRGETKKEKFLVREFTHLLERDNPKKVALSFLLCGSVSLWPSYSA